MSLYCKFRVWREINKEEEEKIRELGLKIDLHAYKPAKQREEIEEIKKEAEAKGIQIPTYNPVHIKSYDCLDLLGAATDVEIGRPGSRTTRWMPIPATPENREIVKKIGDILLQK